MNNALKMLIAVYANMRMNVSSNPNDAYFTLDELSKRVGYPRPLYEYIDALDALVGSGALEKREFSIEPGGVIKMYYREKL